MPDSDLGKVPNLPAYRKSSKHSPRAFKIFPLNMTAIAGLLTTLLPHHEICRPVLP